MNTSALNVSLQHLVGNSIPYYVVPADKVMEKVALDRFPIICIVNTKNHMHKGEHWVCFYIFSSKAMEYFDSFANPLESYPEIEWPVEEIVRESCVPY